MNLEENRVLNAQKRLFEKIIVQFNRITVHQIVVVCNYSCFYLYRSFNSLVDLQDSHHTNEMKDKPIEIVNVGSLTDKSMSFHYFVGPMVTFYLFSLTFLFPI